jgi:hypothetical protein
MCYVRLFIQSLIRVVVTVGCWHVMESEYSSVLSSFSQRGWYSALIPCSEFSEISMTSCMTEDWERAAPLNGLTVCLKHPALLFYCV